VVHVEPRIYDTKRLRPDLDILLPDQQLMLDVQVTFPGSPSFKSLKPLAAAKNSERKKINLYKAWAEERGGKFFPFVVESLGALGNHANKVLKLLSKAASTVAMDLSTNEFMALARKSISVALQRGNGLVAKLGSLQARASHAAGVRAARA
jgi:hypothetical protein